MTTPARNLYQIKILRRILSARGTFWEDLMATEASTTRSGVVEIATRLQNVYPKPGHKVQVHLLDHVGRKTQVEWETPEE